MRVLPDGCIDLLWTGDALVVAGPDTGPFVETFAPGATIVGVRFRPGAAPGWLGVAADEIANQRVPLAALWGGRARRLEQRLLESATPAAAAAAFEQELAAHVPAPPDPGLEHLRRALEVPREPHLRQLTRDLGLSERTLRRRCHEAFGYGPATLARILRFQRFLTAARGAQHPSLAELADEAGYADQAHLSRDARRLSGLTPRGIIAQLRSP
jgi:AraC-like DNA-binding protein